MSQESQESEQVETRDLVIIGAGPGGYVAAIRAAQLGMSVTLVDRRASLGGTCLNIGCIPSKALLTSSEHYFVAKNDLADHGISVTGINLNLDTMMQRKAKVVKQLTRGVGNLITSNGIEFVQGFASLKENLPDGGALVNLFPMPKADSNAEPAGDLPGDFDPAAAGQARSIKARRVVLATGSQPVELPGLEFDGDRVLSSTHALSLTEVPKQLCVIGGGIVGLEMASLWARLGSKVTVVELTAQILPGWEPRIAGVIRKQLEALGITFRLSTKASIKKRNKKSVELTLVPVGGESGASKTPSTNRTADEPRNHSGGDSDPTNPPGNPKDSGSPQGAPEAEGLKVDTLLVSVGRRPFTQGLGLEKLGITPGKGGFLPVTDSWQVVGDDGPVPGIYAIGDLIPGPMLAHKAEEEGSAVAEMLAGHSPHVSYDTIPGVVYTWPEAAMVGKTEAQLQEANIPYNKGAFPMSANGRALAMGENVGQVIIYAHAETDRILGAHIVGPWASDLMSEIVTVMELKGCAEDIARIVHAHPTLSEAVKEAALSVAHRSIHSVNPKKKR